MTATARTCVIITCDLCGNAWGDGDGTDYHWATLDEARGAASGDEWFLGHDGTTLCNSEKPDHDDKAHELYATLARDDRDELLVVRPWADRSTDDEDEED